VTVTDGAGLGDHVDVGIHASVVWVRIANLENLGGPAGSVDQMVSIGLPAPECSAVPGAQELFTGIGDQGQFALQHPDEFVLVTVPVPLARPAAGLDDREIDAEQGEAGVARQPPDGLRAAG
jgi:hypothetical protein